MPTMEELKRQEEQEQETYDPEYDILDPHAEKEEEGPSRLERIREKAKPVVEASSRFGKAVFSTSMRVGRTVAKAGKAAGKRVAEQQRQNAELAKQKAQKKKKGKKKTSQSEVPSEQRAFAPPMSVFSQPRAGSPGGGTVSSGLFERRNPSAPSVSIFSPLAKQPKKSTADPYDTSAIIRPFGPPAQRRRR